MAINIPVKIKCSVLFDITQTNVSSRRSAEITPELIKQRNQQSNFETILQIISLRCQPENISTPTKNLIDVSKSWLGTDYRKIKSPLACWSFEFTIHHSSVFNNGDDELGKLFQDCQDVPMISELEESANVINHLDTSAHLKNITFEVIDREIGY